MAKAVYPEGKNYKARCDYIQRVGSECLVYMLPNKCGERNSQIDGGCVQAKNNRRTGGRDFN